MTSRLKQRRSSKGFCDKYPYLDPRNSMEKMGMAKCSKCERELYLDKFYKSPYNKIGRDYQCKECKNKYTKQRYRLSKGGMNGNSKTKKENRYHQACNQDYLSQNKRFEGCKDKRDFGERYCN